jgi:hypothetical protein
VGGACDANRREEDHVEFIGNRARGKDTTRKTKTWMDLLGIGSIGMDWIGLAQG